MAELWQTYGNWIIYGTFFVLMIGHHFFMGHGGHRERSAGDDTAHAAHAHGSAAATDAPAQAQRRRHSGGCHWRAPV